jgi:hypothetical protein
MIRIRNLSQDFLDFWEEARDESQEDQLKLWQELYDSKHPEVFQVYFGPPYFGRRECLPDALQRYAKDVERIGKTAEGIEELLPKIIAGVLSFFALGEDEIEIDVIAFVGIYHASGFVFPVGGRTTVFLALENLAEYESDRVKIGIAHELSHALQFALGQRAASQLSAAFMDDPLSLFTRIDARLFAEGFAISASRQIIPAQDQPDYLFYTAEQWTWCQANRNRLVEMTLRGLAGDDQEVYTKLFQMFESREGAEGLPYQQTGYYVGYLAIEKLLERYTLRELAEVEPGEFPKLICRALANDFGRD